MTRWHSLIASEDGSNLWITTLSVLTSAMLFKAGSKRCTRHGICWPTSVHVRSQGEGSPELPHELANETREAVMQMGLIQAMASFETEDSSPSGFPKVVFSVQIKTVSPIKYWQYVSNVTITLNPEKFATMITKVFHLPLSSAGIDRIFSTAGLVQSKLRNRLSVAKVGRLITVTRLLHNGHGNSEGSWSARSVSWRIEQKFFDCAFENNKVYVCVKTQICWNL